jgi:hypothetical protein
MESEAAWYYLQDSRQIGPYRRSELEGLLMRGVISADTLVWKKNRSWEPIGSELQIQGRVAPQPRRAWMLLLAAALFCGGLSYKVTTPGRSGAVDNTVLVAASEVPTAGMQRVEPFSPPLAAVQPRVPSAGNQLVQEYWRAIAHSKVIGRYEYYLRRSPSGSFAADAAERIKELSSEALPEQPGVKRKKAQTPIRSRPRPAKASPKPNAPVVAKKIDRRCWSRNIEECRDRCRNGERLACHKLVRLGG